MVGHETFGTNRYLNQSFYRSKEWKRARNETIIRDNGCDLGILGREINDAIYVHHMNPVTVEDLDEHYDLLLDPEFLICTLVWDFISRAALSSNMAGSLF